MMTIFAAGRHRRHTTPRCVIVLLALLLTSAAARSQNFDGMSGLIATPSADMRAPGEFSISSNFLNHNFMPHPSSGENAWTYEGKPYNTGNVALTITMFRWLEVGYTITLFKALDPGHEKPAYNRKDRHFSVKINPLREGRYWPAIAIGGNDVLKNVKQLTGKRTDMIGYFCNYYIVATKHFKPYGQDFSVNLAYRLTRGRYTENWKGIVGGITWRPRWVPDMRVVAEYNNKNINTGVDYLLWKHLFAQAWLTDGRYFSGGLAFRANLF